MLTTAGGSIRRQVAAFAGMAAFAAPVEMAQSDVVLIGTDGNDVLTGTAASESIYGRAGDDRIEAGPGDDELDGGPGADVLGGGPGSDAVSYGESAQVTVTLDGAAKDGAGEGDNVGTDVEDIFGGEGRDKLEGSGTENTIDGAGGGDDIDGRGGTDALFGGDDIDGRGGTDALFGGDGDDTIEARDHRSIESTAGLETTWRSSTVPT